MGCNFLPSTAINQLEMFQDDTFDLDTIKKEISQMENDIEKKIESYKKKYP